MNQSNDEDRTAEREETLRRLFHEHFRQEVPFETSESILKAGRAAMRRRRRPAPKMLWLSAAATLLVVGSVLFRLEYFDNGKAVNSDRSSSTQITVDERPSQMVALDQLRIHLARIRKPSSHRVTSMTHHSSPSRKYGY
jgi:hypothetical protein